MKTLVKLGLVMMLLFAALRWPAAAKAAPPYSNYWCGNAYFQQKSFCEQQMYSCTEYCPQGGTVYQFCYTDTEPGPNGTTTVAAVCYQGPHDSSCMQGCNNNINSCIINALQTYCTPAP